MVAGACLPAVAAAQAQVGGVVARMAAGDTAPVAGARVVLHMLTATHQGPVDSVLSDPAGRFRFKVKADTSALLLASSRHDGIEYFSRPARATAQRPDTGLAILVADTSSSAPVSLAGRYLMLGRPEQGGRRGALDLMVLQNRGDRTRVARDSTLPVWSMPLPAGVENFTPGESEFSAAAVGHKADSLTISAPLSPGDRQLMVTYTLPPGIQTLRVPFAGATDSIVFLLEEPTARVVTPGFAAGDSQVIESRTYHRWVGSLPDAGVVELKFPVPGEGGRAATLALAALLAAGLLLGGIALIRRRDSGLITDAATSRDPAALIEAIARLDAQYAGREGEVGPASWSRYQAQRAELKAALDVALATRAPVR